MDRDQGNLTRSRRGERLDPGGAAAHPRRQYGEERYAASRSPPPSCRRRRTMRPLRRPLELVDVIRSAMPASAPLREKQHPAKRSFQAIRIAVNDELAGRGPDGARRPSPGPEPGRAAGGHHLPFPGGPHRQDRPWPQSARGCTCPPEFPVCVCGKKPKVKLITRKPLTASEEELAENPRSRSAKLRVCEKL